MASGRKRTFGTGIINEHRHVIDFTQTSETVGFTSAPGIDGDHGDQLAYFEAWQFQVRPMTNWRAHGFMSDDTFFIVWLGPHHNLYPLPGVMQDTVPNEFQ